MSSADASGDPPTPAAAAGPVEGTPPPEKRHGHHPHPEDWAESVAALKSELLESVFTSDMADDVIRRGWCKVDGFLGREKAMELHVAALDLARPDGGMFSPHKFQFAGKVFGKPNIYEIDLHDASKRESVPALRHIFHVLGPAVVQAAHEAFPTLDLDATAASAIKVQLNAGGSFPCHYDNPGPLSPQVVFGL